MDGLEKPKVFYKYRFKHQAFDLLFLCIWIYHSYTHKSCERKKDERKKTETNTAVFTSTFFTENFLAAGYYSPWGQHPRCKVGRKGKKQLIELDEFTALPHQGPQSESGMKTSHTLTCIDNSLVAGKASEGV